MSCIRQVLLAGIACLFLSCSIRVMAIVTFVQVADPQLGMGRKGYQQDVAMLEQAVAQINNLQPTFVIVCGDLADRWTADAATDAASCLKALTVPWYVAPGNHDGWTSAEYKQFFAPDHQVVEAENLRLVKLNTNLWRKGQDTAGDEQLTWLERALREGSDKGQVLLVAGHHPLFVNAAEEKDSDYNTPLARRAKILALFEQYHVAAYLSGHLHLSIVGYYHGTALVSSASVVRNTSTEPLGYRVWHADKDGFLTQYYEAVTLPAPGENQ